MRLHVKTTKTPYSFDNNQTVLNCTQLFIKFHTHRNNDVQAGVSAPQIYTATFCKTLYMVLNIWLGEGCKKWLYYRGLQALRSNQVSSIQWVAGTYRATEVTLCLSDWLQAYLYRVVLFPYRLTERQWAHSSIPVHWRYPSLSCCCCQTLNWKDQRKYVVDTCTAQGSFSQTIQLWWLVCSVLQLRAI